MRFDSDISVKIKDAYSARHEPEAVRLLARAYWTFLVLVCAVLVTSGVVYGVWEFVRTPAEPESSVSVRSATTFTKGDLQELLKGFGDRALRFEERMKAPVSVTDPS